jgi:hypothetical protein
MQRDRASHGRSLLRVSCSGPRDANLEKHRELKLSSAVVAVANEGARRWAPAESSPAPDPDNHNASTGRTLGRVPEPVTAAVEPSEVVPKRFFMVGRPVQDMESKVGQVDP